MGKKIKFSNEMPNIGDKIMTRLFFGGSEVKYSLWWFDHIYPHENKINRIISCVKNFLFPPRNHYSRTWLRNVIVIFLYSQVRLLCPLIERINYLYG